MSTSSQCQEADGNHGMRRKSDRQLGRDFGLDWSGLVSAATDSPVAPRLASEESVETERERVANLLHDEILQSFATCLLRAQLCEKLAEMERYELLRQELPRLEDILNDAIDRVRALATRLKEPDSEAN